MDSLQAYATNIIEQIRMIADSQRGSIEQAAEKIAQAHQDGRSVFVFGPGVHSFIGVEELFYRSGGLAFIRPIGEAAYTLLGGALHATRLERTPGLARSVLESYGVAEGDVLIINNAYGINCGCIDAALYCRERKVVSIAVTSSAHSQAIPKNHPARHPSGANLFEVADLFIDTFVPVGDGVVFIGEGDDRIQVGPCSTIGMATALNLLVCAVVERLRDLGAPAEIWKSGNAPGGDEFNRRHLEKYGDRIKHLR